VVNYIASKIQRYRSSGVLVDTNLLLVYLVGLYDTVTGYRLVNDFKYTKGDYEAGDFDLLLAFLEQFDVRITTPHILAEVSNSIIGELADPAKDLCLGLLQEAIPAAFYEHHAPANALLAEVQFRTYGVTDMGILQSAVAGTYLVLTDDNRLSPYLNQVGVETLSLSEIKYA
jgi:hypothetical protein